MRLSTTWRVEGVRKVERRLRFEALIGDLGLRFGVSWSLIWGSLRGRLEGVVKAMRAVAFKEDRFEGVLLFPEASESKSKRPMTRPSFWAVGAREAW